MDAKENSGVKVPMWALSFVGTLLVAAVAGGAEWLSTLSETQNIQAVQIAEQRQAQNDMRGRLERIENKIDDVLKRLR